jgi:transposase
VVDDGRGNDDGGGAGDAGLRQLVEQLRADNEQLRADNERLATEVSELTQQLAVVVAKLDEREREVAELTKKIIGRTTERSGRTRKENPREKNDAAAQAKRRAGRERRKELPEETVHHKVDPARRETCPRCGSQSMVGLQPERSVEYEWVPGHLVRRVHEQEKVLCTTCKAFSKGPAPTRVVDGGQYGPGFIARVVVHKMLDCIPLYRQSKMFAREGLDVHRSVLIDLFHLAASLLEPLHTRMLELVKATRLVYADETSLKMQRVKKLGFIWTFATALYVTYVFSPDRSGKTPQRVLGGSTGLLLVDAYTGYNNVTIPEGRLRAGCNSHARRKFVDIDHDGARLAIEKYKEVFAVEREAKERDIVGTPEHLALRQARAGPAMEAIRRWCQENKGAHGPKTPLGKAIGYFINQWEYLTRFIHDVSLEPSNNLSERLLRIIALGRKNYLFVGHEAGGQNAAILASLAQTCVLHGVDPQRYLADVLIRIQTHPAHAIDELLPHRWKDPLASSPADG